MKQSTFSAQVANNLLTVLQGYSKTIRLLLVMFLTLTVSANAWGQTWTRVTTMEQLTSGGTFIMGYEATAKSGIIVPLRSADCNATTSANGYFYTGTTANSSTNSTITMSSVVNTSAYEVYISSPASEKINIQRATSTGNYYGASSGGSSKNTARLYTEGNTTETNLIVEWASETNNQFKLRTEVSGNYKYLKYNTSSPRFAFYNSAGEKIVFYKKSASSYTITATSNNNSYGTVSVSGTTITATPNDGYRVKSGDAGYTVTDGTADVTNNGDNTFSVTPSSDCIITINFEVIPQYTVTWDVNGDQSVTTQVTEGSKPTFPATPSSCDATSNTFYGWATATWDGKINDVSAKTIYTSANNMPAVNGAVTYYAVFAEATTTGGGGGSTTTEQTKTETFENQTTSSTYNSTKEYDATSSNAGIAWKIYYGTVSTNAVLNGSQSAQMRWYNSASANLPYIQSTTLVKGLKSISFTALTSDNDYKYSVSYSTNGTSWTSVATGQSVGSTSSKQTKSYTINANGVDAYIKIAITSTTNVTDKATFRIDDVVFTYLETTSGGGGSTTTYDNYITTCAAGDPCASLQAPNVTATATANSITLSWAAVDGATSYNVYNYTTADLDETTSLTYTFTGLSSETEYEWGVESAKDECFKETRGTTTTPAAASPATITLSELGVTTTDNTTYYVGAQYTLPTTSSQSCDGKELVGWSTVEVVETDTKPTSNYYELGAEVTLAATQTFYAVFATEGGVPSTDYNQITSIEDLTDGNYVIAYGYNTTSPTIILKAETKDETTLVATSAGPTDNKYTDPAASNIWEIKKTNTTYTLYNAATSKYIQATNTPSLKLADADPTEFQISYSTDHWKIKLNTANTYQLVGYTNASGNYFQTKGSPSNSYKIQLYKSASTVVYSAYTTSCIPTYSITYDFEGGTGSHCSNTSVPQGGSYTICDEAPTKEGNTFLHWSDGVHTYNPSDVIATVTTDITLTAVWQPNTYTVTWNNNGVETEVPYNHGVALVVPEAPESCDGVKEFVGWTEQSGYYHATTAPTDLFKTTTATVTADKTYYAVFATKGAGGTEFVLGESGTFKMYANVNGTNYYAQGGVSSSQITSTTNALSASDYTLTYAEGSYTIQQGTSNIGHTSTNTNLSNNATEWIISAGSNGSWRVQSSHDESRALSYSSSANAFKAYATSNITAGDDTYFDIEFGTGSSGYSDYTTTCQQVESIEVQNPQTEFYLTDDFTIGSGKVIATLSGGGTTDVTAFAHFSGYNMEATGTQTVTVTYMGSTATYEITVKPLDNAWVLTWNVSGKTNTGLGPRSVTKGNAIDILPVPEVPASCAGKTFMGWTESNIVPSDGKGIVYITEETVPTKNTTYYAVFATINNFSTQAAIEDIKSGSKVVIVAVASMDASGGAGQAISSRTISTTSKGVIGLSGDEVSIFDETINTPHSTCIWTLTKEGGGIVFEQGGKYIRAVDGGYRRLLLETTKDYWTLSPVTGKDKTYHMQSGNTSHYVEWFDHTDSQYDEGERYIGFIPYTAANNYGDFDMQFYVTANADGKADTTDYTTGCAEYTITYYGFHGGYSTSCSSDGTIVLPVNSIHTIPNCEGLVINDHTNLGREFLNVWMTQPHGGHTFKPGDTFILTSDTTLYAQWKMETTSDVTTLPTDIEDLAGTDIYVYGGTTLNIQPGTTTINSLTLKGGLQADGSYKMPTVWVPEGATLVRNSNKINLDLIVNAKTWYPFAVPFAAKNNKNVEYLDSVLAAASTYGTHFAIKTYDGARRAKVGEDKANNWVRVLRDSTLQPGVGYIITALTRPDKDTATIRIPMTVPNTWFQNGEQAEVGTTVRNTIAVTAHAGAAADEHQRHAGWNFVANPYLTSFAGGNVANDGGLDYINGELIIEGSYVYGGDPVPYVTIPAYDFAYYSQHKLSEVKLSPEWSFFVQVGTGGTMNFTTAGRQQAPASIAARNAEERPVKMDVDLILSDNHSSDQTGIIISDRYTDAYEIGRDLEKLFGSAYNLSVYTLMEDNTPLAFQALAIRSSMQVIPVGYRAPEQGEYTFRLNEATSSIDLLNEQYEQLVLVDYQTGELTNLLYTDYTFYSERTQSNSRFAIYAVPRQNAPTDLPNAIGSDEEVRKVIYNDHLYILRDGNVYNGMGQKM